MLVVILLLSCVFAVAEGPKPILFQNIPWGTDYTSVDNTLSDLKLWQIKGEAFDTKPMEDITWNRYIGKTKFEYTDINIIAHAFNKEMNVAGYTTSDIVLYFAYTPVDGVLTHEDKDTALYGATYQFEPADTDSMVSDLKSKLISIYGEPNRAGSDTDFVKNSYEITVWTDTNGGVLVLGVQHAPSDSTLYKDTIWISYIYSEADNWLQAASDAEKAAALAAQSAVSGNGDVSGL